MADLKLSYLGSLMRHAADFAERNHVNDESGNQKPRLAGDRQQNARAQKDADQHVNQNRQSKFHYDDYKIFVEVRKPFNKPKPAPPHLNLIRKT
jgi:hypothetical protein